MTKTTDTEPDDRVDVDTKTGDRGGTRAAVSSGSSFFGAIHLPEIIGDQSHLHVDGYAYDDEPGEVECSIGIGGGSVILTFSPERARRFARELETAVEEVEAHD